MNDQGSNSPLADRNAGGGAAAPAAPKPQRVQPKKAAKPAAAQPKAEAGAAPARRPAKDRPMFGERRPSLKLNATRPGYVPRWINDEPGRVDFAKECGYEHIKGDDGKPIARVVDKSSGILAYAMEIPRDLYDADFERKRRRNDTTDQAIMSKPIAGGYRPVDQATQQPVTQATVVRGSQPVLD